ncbi:hypothetical protein, partial [Xanthomonas perforans]
MGAHGCGDRRRRRCVDAVGQFARAGMTDTPAERPDPGVAGDADWAAQARPLLVHADMRLCKRFD